MLTLLFAEDARHADEKVPVDGFEGDPGDVPVVEDLLDLFCWR